MLHNLGLQRELWYLQGTDTPYAASRELSTSSLLKARLCFQEGPICISENTFPSLILLLLFPRQDRTLPHVKRKNYRRLNCCAIQSRSHRSGLAVTALPMGMAQDLAKLERGDWVLRKQGRIIQWLRIPWDRCLASPPDQNYFLCGFYYLNSWN